MFLWVWSDLVNFGPSKTGDNRFSIQFGRSIFVWKLFVCSLLVLAAFRLTAISNYVVRFAWTTATSLLLSKLNNSGCIKIVFVPEISLTSKTAIYFVLCRYKLRLLFQQSKSRFGQTFILRQDVTNTRRVVVRHTINLREKEGWNVCLTILFTVKFQPERVDRTLWSQRFPN